MRINVVGRHMEITPAIEGHAEKKSAKLTKRYDDWIQQLDFTVSQEAADKQVFKAELLVAVRSHPEMVAKSDGQDVYVLIDEVIHKAERQLHDLKERLKDDNR